MRQWGGLNITLGKQEYFEEGSELEFPWPILVIFLIGGFNYICISTGRNLPNFYTRRQNFLRWNKTFPISTVLKTEKLKLWTNLKTQIVTKLKKIVTQLKLVKLWQNSNCDKTPKIKLWQNSKTQIVTLVIVKVMTGAVVIGTYFSKNNLTHQQPLRYSQCSFLQLLRCFLWLSLGKVKKFMSYFKTCWTINKSLWLDTVLASLNN